MTDGTTDEPGLFDVRRRLDAVDGQLVDLLVARLRLIEEVIGYKRANGMGVVDRSREDAMLASIETVATAKGLDPRIARTVLRSVIEAFTLLEVEHLGDQP